MTPRPLKSVADPDWLQLRQLLWSDASEAEHLEEMESFLSQPEKYAQFVLRDEHGQALGFIEASIRTDYVNGTETSPVAFLEGIYVRPRARRKGVACRLVQAVEHWARSNGISELASDALTRNRTSHAVHKSLGFVETERVVYFCKHLK